MEKKPKKTVEQRKAELLYAAETLHCVAFALWREVANGGTADHLAMRATGVAGIAAGVRRGARQLLTLELKAKRGVGK